MRIGTVPRLLTWTTRVLTLAAVAVWGRAEEAAASDASPMAGGLQMVSPEGQIGAMEIGPVQVGDVDEDGGGPPLLE